MGCQSSCLLQSQRQLLIFTNVIVNREKLYTNWELYHNQLDWIKQDSLVQICAETCANIHDFDIMKCYEITYSLNWEPWIEELLISTLCGDQCHCWKRGCGKLGKAVVANQHGAKCVKCAWLITGACKSQNDMGTGWGEYCLSILMQFEVI